MNRNRAARFMTRELLLSQGYVRTPGGYRHKSFVHQLRPGQAVRKRNGTLHFQDLVTKSLTPVPAPVVSAQNLAGSGGGWVTWATWVNASGRAISSFATTWVVPAAPITESDQLIYLFNGLEDQAGDNILQPVLQWGVSGAGGGNTWGVASWYVDVSHHAFCTPLLPVNVGDILVGVMTLEIQADASLNYACEFQGIPGTKLIAQGLPELVQACEALEVYGLTKSTDYPNAPMTAMTKIDLQTMDNPAPLNWVPELMSNPTFGEHTDIVSNATPGGEVDLYY